MTKSVKTVVYSADGTQTQVYPETHYSAVFGLDEHISDVIAKDYALAAGTNLNSLTSGKYQGSRTYVINGVDVQNSPADSKYTKWASITVTDINGNTATQLLIDSAGHRWTRGAGGQNKTWNNWKEF